MSSKYAVDICIELGIQSINVNTLKKINRAHGLAEYIQACMIIKSYGFEVCTHIISTLPWDSDDDVKEASRIISVLDTDSVKLHSMYIEKNTELASMYSDGEFELLSLDDYVRRTVDFIELLNPKISIQRLSARAPKERTIFCNWDRSHWVLDSLVEEELKRRNSYQGKFSDNYSCDSALKNK